MKLLIADDDFQIRTGLKEGIEWLSFGITEVFIAQDGLEAMKIYEDKMPQIVITDIRMPGLDGLQLTEKIREISQDTSIIILSGYAEFEYARKALQFGVNDYLLKPVKIRELTKIVYEITNKIIKLSQKAEDEKNFKSSYVEKFINDFISGNIDDMVMVVDKFKTYFNLDIKTLIGCLILEIDNDLSGVSNSALEHKKSLYKLIKDIILSQFDVKDTILHEKYNKVILIYRVNSTSSKDILKLKFFKLHKELNKSLKEECKLTVSFGISNTGTIESFKKIYEQGEQALAQRLYKGAESINFYEEIKYKDSNIYSRTIDENKLKENILSYNFEGLKIIISNGFQNLKSEKISDRYVIRDICINLKNVLIRAIEEISIEFVVLFADKISFPENLENFQTIDEYKAWILNIYNIAINELSIIKGTSHNVLMMKAAVYIKINFNKDLTVDEIAKHIQKNPNYFSHLFKKEFGVSFCEYLNKIRISEAKNLFNSTNLLAYEIADKVGFKDYKYFTQVFKKLEGYAPSKFRKGTT